jgi:hypothetical protein
MFEVYDVPESERFEMARKAEFFRSLVDQREHFRAGDIVMIRGYMPYTKPGLPRVQHTHTFYVYENDPVTGMPIALVGNPGRPSIRPWIFEALRTPKRSIWHSIRPRLEWLESIVRMDEPKSSEVPPSLSVGPS